eukprot:TRINITY_DN2321_c0_g1_i17.p1 TRINITY_DN2321_c0_g1~~TRINITY_DN2321_c0_g1_i17.p1  ORF type:complete len:737 (-),score=197.47 TRINITY_DN2321_c0_g1_i17:2097-4307(-)
MKRCQGACTEATQVFGRAEPCSPPPGESWDPLPAQADDDAAAVAAAAAAAAATAPFAGALAAVVPEALRLTDTCSSLSSAADPLALATDPWEVPEPRDPDRPLDLAVKWDRAANTRFDGMELALPPPHGRSPSNVSSGNSPPRTMAGGVDSSDCPEADLAAQLQRSVLDAKAGTTPGPSGGVLTSPTNFLGFAAAVTLFQSSSLALMCGLWDINEDGPSRMVARALVGVYSSSAEDQQGLRIRASEALAPTAGVPPPPLSSPPPGSSDFVRAVPLLARLLRQQHRAGTVDVGALSGAELSALAAVSGGADLSTAVATLAGLLSVEGAPLLLASALEDEADGRSRSGSGSGSGSGGGAQSVRAAGATASVRGRGGTGGAAGSVDQSDVQGDDGTGKKRRRARKNLEELAHNTILYNRAIRNRESARRSNERRKQRRQAARSGAAGGETVDGAARVDGRPSAAGVFSPVGPPPAVAGGGADANDATGAAAVAAAPPPPADPPPSPPAPDALADMDVTTAVGDYVLYHTLGVGEFSKVKYAKHKDTGDAVAIKVMSKSTIKERDFTSQVKHEISILKRLNHRHIVHLREVLMSSSKLYLVMDLVNGGELFQLVETKGALAEDAARRFFHQLVDAISYCHSVGVSHRDLKPENLLVDKATGTSKSHRLWLLRHARQKSTCSSIRNVAHQTTSPPRSSTSPPAGTAAPKPTCGPSVSSSTCSSLGYCRLIPPTWTRCSTPL